MSETLPEITPADEAAMRSDETAPAAPQPVDTPATPEPEAKDAAGAEPKPEPKAEPEKEPKTVVPLAAMLEERKEHKRQIERMEERFQQLVQRFAPAQQPAAPPKPSVDEQPVEVLRDIVQRVERQDIERQQMAQQAQLADALTAAEMQFAATVPDYEDATQHYTQQRAQELALFGNSPMQIREIMRNEALGIAQVAFQQGRNPAELAYSLAKQRGYAGKKAEAPKAPEPDAQRQIETLAKGSAASMSLGTAGGAPNEGGLSLKALADMSNEDFAKISDADFMKAMMRG
jgi:hypothetical protein